ncbi:unnamed protein product [Owenia fusiformis]|uniref:Uncharacterized protein n=1 Tax=Owenia fusiformis TaxID=6347 RepID=A0A8J1U6Q5_OWEFU|nr:unnamed protein product [Owenia fusiformis]
MEVMTETKEKQTDPVIEHSFSTRLKEFGEDVEFHGVRHLFRDNSIVTKVTWILLFLCGCSWLTYQIHDRIIYYYQFPHITKIDKLYVPSLDFPTITICNINTFRRHKLNEYDLLHYGTSLNILDENWTLLHPEHYDKAFDDWVYSINWTDVEIHDRSINHSMEEMYERAGHQIEDMLIYCKWKQQECSVANFTLINTHYGRCYQFNSGKDGVKHQSFKGGKANGLKLYLNVEELEYLNYMEASDLGFKILAHDQDEPPLIQELGFGVTTGNHYFIALETERVTSLPDPYGNCEEDHKLDHYDHYSIPACRIECETLIVEEKCSCRLVEMHGDHGIRVCTAEEYHDCALPTLESITESDTCVCQNPCELTQFQHSISSVKLRESAVEMIHGHTSSNINLTEFKKNLLVVNLFFDSLNYQYIEQTVAYPGVSLLSDVGGQMGLCIGASILTVLHLVQFAIGEIIKKFQKRENKEVNTNVIHVASANPVDDKL